MSEVIVLSGALRRRIRRKVLASGGTELPRTLVSLIPLDVVHLAQLRQYIGAFVRIIHQIDENANFVITEPRRLAGVSFLASFEGNFFVFEFRRITPRGVEIETVRARVSTSLLSVSLTINEDK